VKTLAMALVLLVLLIFAPATGFAGNDNFKLCPAEVGTAGKFADCTEAQCKWNRKSTDMKCRCTVREDVSSLTAASIGCQQGSDSALQSRYPGVQQMGVCESATNQWGNCLGVTCGPDDAGETHCLCPATTSEAQSETSYVVVGVSADGAAAACAPDAYYSSATPSSVFSASAHLGSGKPAISWHFP